MNGILYGIGVGPGDPELMTLKAVRICRECDVVAIPHKNAEKCLALQIALGAVPELKEKPILSVDMPMTKDPEILARSHRAGAEAVVRCLEQGKNVVFLTLGDPTVYSTYFYIHELVEAMGHKAVVIPGITSFCAASAALGKPLCMNAEQLHIIPGTYSLEDGLEAKGTRVFMKNNVPEVRKALQERDLNVAMVENCGLPTQRLFRSALELPEQSGYYTLFIVKD